MALTTLRNAFSPSVTRSIQRDGGRRSSWSLKILGICLESLRSPLLSFMNVDYPLTRLAILLVQYPLVKYLRGFRFHRLSKLSGTFFKTTSLNRVVYVARLL